MPDRIFIGVAWPYANGSLHLGHIAGCYLPADIFARYHRAKGDDVLMVSGSDSHGTPVTIRAEQEQLSPRQVVEKYQAEFQRCWDQMGISFDLYTTTMTDNHREVVHRVFLDLKQKGDIVTGVTVQPFCPKDKRFLPDRYVNGTCPHCGFERARGDQCDRCGKPLNPSDLLNGRCRICGTAPEFRETEHYFLRLSAFQERLLEWFKDKDYWRPHVLNFTRQFVAGGLQDRSITRDLLWGVTVPVEGFEDKRIYVWFEAVIGYLSASVEWAARQGRPDAWRPFWQDPSTRSYYFIGKDNIPFHTIIWPAMLMGYGDWRPGKGGAYNLPFDVPANEFLSLESRKFSTSENWAVWLPDYLSRYQPDPLRYYLSASMPENADADFSWAEFVRRNNDELVATYGNLVHRVLTITHRNFDHRVPEPGSLGDADRALLARAEQAVKESDDLLGRCRFKDALRVAMSLAQEANRYVDAKAPWRSIKSDRQATATTLWTAVQVISTLKTLTYPFIPFSAEKLHAMLGLPGTAQATGWRVIRVEAGTALPEPQVLFTKLEPSVVAEETARLGKPA